MAGNLLLKARRDAKRIMMGGFSEDITITTPDDLTSILTKGLASKHYINFDSDGLPINSKNAHICLDELDLLNKGYTVRNSINEVSILNHKVNVSDSTGIVKNYIITETFPDETIGLIVCILGDYGIN
jgi:hypothetical protein|tara:strand:+ start:200 stop:583 length:384 start_codon:yes stop_codon:yes gene_type:complete